MPEEIPKFASASEGEDEGVHQQAECGDGDRGVVEEEEGEGGGGEKWEDETVSFKYSLTRC